MDSRVYGEPDSVSISSHGVLVSPQTTVSASSPTPSRDELRVAVISTTSGPLAELSADEFVSRLQDYVSTRDTDSRDVLARVLDAFRRVRATLGLQLDHAHGNLSEDEFEHAIEPWLDEEARVDDIPREILSRMARIVVEHAPEPVDAETLATLLKCSLDAADAELNRLAESERLGGLVGGRS